MPLEFPLVLWIMTMTCLCIWVAALLHICAGIEDAGTLVHAAISDEECPTFMKSFHPIITNAKTWVMLGNLGPTPGFRVCGDEIPGRTGEFRMNEKRFPIGT